MGQLKKFDTIVIGGTFDHLHAGHTYLVDESLACADRVIIGVATDAYVKNKHFSQSIQSYGTRLSALKSYVKAKHDTNKTLFIPLSDIYGNTLERRDIQAIVVTSHTRANAVKINQARVKKGWPALKIIQLSLKTIGGNRAISSTMVREGTIDREGTLYRRVYGMARKLLLPATLRDVFRQPIGSVYPGRLNEADKVAKQVIRYIHKIKPTLVITVGDMISLTLERAGYTPGVSVIDFKSQRKPLSVPRPSKKLIARLNPQGMLATQAAESLRYLIKKISTFHTKEVMIIKGEEDLMVTAAVLHAPLNSLVIYGQRDLGVVVVEVTEEKKKEIYNLLGRFDRRVSKKHA